MTFGAVELAGIAFAHGLDEVQGVAAAHRGAGDRLDTDTRRLNERPRPGCGN